MSKNLLHYYDPEELLNDEDDSIYEEFHESKGFRDVERDRSAKQNKPKKIDKREWKCNG